MDKEDLEGDLSEQTPNQPDGAVTQKGVKQPSVTSKSVEQELEDLKKQVRSLQGEKDRGVSKLKNEFEGYKPLLEAIKGFVPAEQLPQVERELEYQDLKQRVYGTSQREQTEPLSGGTQKGIDAEDLALKTVEKLGLDLNDPKVADAIRSSQGVDMVMSLMEIATQKAKAPQPTIASSAAISSGSSQATLTDADIADKAGQLDKLYLNPTVNAKKIAELEKELGWDK